MGVGLQLDAQEVAQCCATSCAGLHHVSHCLIQIMKSIRMQALICKGEWKVGISLGVVDVAQCVMAHGFISIIQGTLYGYASVYVRHR